METDPFGGWNFTTTINSEVSAMLCYVLFNMDYLKQGKADYIFHFKGAVECFNRTVLTLQE